jgi:hypothetical protein
VESLEVFTFWHLGVQYREASQNPRRLEWWNRNTYQ